MSLAGDIAQEERGPSAMTLGAAAIAGAAIVFAAFGYTAEADVRQPGVAGVRTAESTVTAPADKVVSNQEGRGIYTVSDTVSGR